MNRRHSFAIAVTLGMVAAVVTAQSRPANMTAPDHPAKILLPTTRLAPDEYGLQDYTVTTIGSVSFTPRSDDTSQDFGFFSAPYNTETPDNGDGFFRYGESGGNESFPSTHFEATVSVPAGAVIDFIGLECWSGIGPDMAEVQLYLVDRYDNITPIAGFQSTQHDHDTDYNSSAIGFQLVRNVHNQLVVDVETNPSGGSGGSFGWVEIWWKRTVSPAPASPTFTDVPTTDPGFQYIEALAASGITAGCGGGHYCPDATLTRRQMAVFLAKALGLQWPY
jgi:hypothetical protein